MLRGFSWMGMIFEGLIQKVLMIANEQADKNENHDEFALRFCRK
jgi:hypothetical protein